MTVSTQTAVVEYLEPGGTNVDFDVPFRFLAAADLIVTRRIGQTITNVAPSLVSGVGNADGGTIRIASSVSGAVLRIRRRTARTQPTDYTPGDRFQAETHELALDRQMMALQETDADVAGIQSRAVLAPVGETISELPPASARANRAMGFGADGLQPVMLEIGGGNDALRTDLANGNSAGARLIAHRRAGATYASVRPAQDEFDEAVKFTQFYDPALGKAGLGNAAADTAAFERCIAYAMANGRAICVPDNPAPFKFNSIDFPKNEIGVDGDTARPTRLLICGPGQIEYVGDTYMFDCSDGYFYDLVIDGPRFVCTSGNGAAAINGDKFIRLVIAPGVQFEKFDYVIRAPNDYLQSVRMYGVICRGGVEAFVKAPMSYDCLFHGCIMEFGWDGIVIDGDGDPAVHTTSIVDNVIEGMAGRGIVLGSCLSSSVIGNYMEGNDQGEVFLNASSVPHKGIFVQLNSFQQTSARLLAGAYSIVWGASSALTARSGGNFCTGHLHDTAGTAGLLDTFGDFVALGKNVSRPNVGRTVDTDGFTYVFRWFDRFAKIDPYQNELVLGGKHNSGGQPPIISFGTASPQAAPALYERTTFARGSVIFNVGAAIGQPIGWICTAAGTPGAWEPFTIL